MASHDDQLMGLLSLKCRLQFKRTSMPSLAGRRQQTKMPRDLVIKQVTPYGQLHETALPITKWAASTHLVVQDPFAMLHLANVAAGELAFFVSGEDAPRQRGTLIIRLISCTAEAYRLKKRARDNVADNV